MRNTTMRNIFLLIPFFLATYSSYSQTWTPVPFSVGNQTGSFTMCNGSVTVTVSNAFVNTSTSGMVSLNANSDALGVIIFSPAIDIRIEDLSSNGSNNGDIWNIVAPQGWTPFGSEATSSGTDLDLVTTSTSLSSGGETNVPTSYLTFNKTVDGGGVIVLFDSDICAILLPIELLQFNAFTTTNNLVKLEWQTASEINNDYFTIENSVNGTEWQVLDRIDGAGNSSTLRSYNTIDNNPYSGVSYYRLKQTDFDGQYSYSQIRSVNLENKAYSVIEVFPNPTESKITIIGAVNNQVKIYNTLGQDVTPFTNQISKSGLTLIIDLSELSEGLYYIKTKNTANKVYKQ